MLRSTLLAVLLCASSFGCAHRVKPVDTDAALGRVVVYRNGVAYFERSARITGNTLALNVPDERIDDLLKSLRVTDADTGEAFPVAYRTGRQVGGNTEMLIQLPGAGPHHVKLNYVTESPAWKPTYRLKLDPKGGSTLEAWAVVDNVSGEDWNDVVIGVGSTSALSFRYDLHSVRVVQRETITDQTPLGMAPPTGGSAYAVADKELTVVGEIGLGELDGLEDDTADAIQAQYAAGVAMEEAARVSKRSVKSRTRKAKAARGDKADAMPGADAPRAMDVGGMASGGIASGPMSTGAAGSGAGATARGTLVAVANRAQQNKKRIRIEGYAMSGEQDAKDASLRRANTVRDQLIKNGVAESQIDVVATGQFREGSGVRVLELDQSAGQPQQAAGDEGTPIGDAYFLSKAPMTLARDQSAMVSLMREGVKAESVYYYDPLSERGSKRYAFRAVRLENPTDDTLDSGPFTVYGAGKFLGEGITDPIMPGSSAFLPYALDRTLVVDGEDSTREEIESLVAIERGVFRTEAQRIRKTTLELANRDQKPAKVFVRHAVPDGWTLLNKGPKIEKLGDAYLIPVTVKGGEAIKLVIEEATPVQKTVDIRDFGGAKAIAAYLEAAEVGESLAKDIERILKAQRDMADAKERIITVRRQMGALRERIDEIHLQLATLRKVKDGKKLVRHLSTRMREISDRLQKATIEVTDLESKVLTKRIEMQDRIAELHLAPRLKDTKLAKKAKE
jgi:hypothetical protein